MGYSSLANSIRSQLNSTFFSHTEDTESREMHKQAAPEGCFSKNLSKHLKGRRPQAVNCKGLSSKMKCNPYVVIMYGCSIIYELFPKWTCVWMKMSVIQEQLLPHFCQTHWIKPKSLGFTNIFDWMWWCIEDEKQKQKTTKNSHYYYYSNYLMALSARDWYPYNCSAKPTQ